MIKKINNLIDKKAMLIFTIFLFLQPILDMFLGVFVNYSVVSGLISILKIFFMLFCLYYVCIIKKNNRKYTLILFIYSLIFLLTNFLLKSNCNIVTEIKFLTKNLFLPVSLLFIVNLFKDNVFSLKKLHIISFIYIILLFIPNILNLGFKSYSYAKLGSVGFFYSANAIGAIISILMPLVVGNFIIKNNKKHLFVFILIYLYILVTIGTKAPILCAAIVLFYYFIMFIISVIKKRQKIKILLLSLLVCVLLIGAIKIFPLTPFYKNLVIHLDFLNINSFRDILTIKNIDHFIFSSRLTYLKESFKTFSKASIFQKLFGIGYAMKGSLLKTSEMDYFVTLIHQGFFGFFISYFLYFRIMFKIFKNYFNKFNLNINDIRKTSIIISLFISILCAFLAGHVLETPSVCIFVTTIMGVAINDFKVNIDKIKIKRIINLYKKYQEIINYLIVGILTTIVSLLTYYICVITFLEPTNAFQLQIANIISWICAVLFAYIANKIIVFKSKTKSYVKEFLTFISARILTLVLDMIIMFIMVTALGINDKISKLFVQIVVTILNYVFSKLFVFRKK